LLHKRLFFCEAGIDVLTQGWWLQNFSIYYRTQQDFFLQVTARLHLFAFVLSIYSTGISLWNSRYFLDFFAVRSSALRLCIRIRNKDADSPFGGGLRLEFEGQKWEGIYSSHEKARSKY
jgi:hypothetical protein